MKNWIEEITYKEVQNKLPLKKIQEFFKKRCYDILLFTISKRDKITSELISRAKAEIPYIINELSRKPYNRIEFLNRLFELSNKPFVNEIFDAKYTPNLNHYHYEKWQEEEKEKVFELLREDLLENTMIVGPWIKGWKLKWWEVCFYTNTWTNAHDVAYDVLIAFDLGNEIMNKKLFKILTMNNFFTSMKVWKNLKECRKWDKFIPAWHNTWVFICNKNNLPEIQIYV